HFADVEKLLLVVNGLVDKGNTVIVIEHNLDVIKTADHIIDMGPEGGAGGGLVISEGTPEEVAADPTSYTGQFLAPVLAGRQPTTKPRRPGAAKKVVAASKATAPTTAVTRKTVTPAAAAAKVGKKKPAKVNGAAAVNGATAVNGTRSRAAARG
ncbi:MAG: excinuclease ABC subunit UvrA, partial [Nakamurella sp.]